MTAKMNATKFTFDTVFADDSDVVSDAAQARKKTTMTQAELEIIRAAALSEGRTSGEVRALEAIAAGAQDAVAALERALAYCRKEIDSVRAHSAEIAFAAARKLARAAIASAPAGEVEAALREAMHQAIGEPRIALRVAPAVADALAPRVAEIAHEEAFEGRVHISADAHLQGADCRIEWRGGGTERSEIAIEAALGELIARRFSTERPLEE
jgi:flagellar assembly protein FliH